MKKSFTTLSYAFLFGALLSLLPVASMAMAEDSVLPLEETRDWAVLADGRVKPLLTYANETVLSVTGRKKVSGLDSLEIFWGYVLAPEDFRDRPLIRVESPTLKETLGLDASARRFSFEEIMGSVQFQELARSAMDRQRDDMDLTPLEKDALSVYSKAARVAELMQGSSLTIIPLADRDGSWSTPIAIQSSTDPKIETIKVKFGELVTAYDQGDSQAFRAAAGSLRIELRNVNPALYPSETVIDRELFYEDMNPFGKAWKFYLLGTLVILLLGFSTKRWLYVSALVLLGAGFACHTMGVGLRWSIGGRAPVSNMYESLIFMGWGIMAIGFVQEAIYKKRFFALAGGLMSFICLAFSENLPIDSSISPLVPVLAHTSWLAIHVMTIMLSYSAFALAMILAHFALFTQLWRPNRDDLIRSLALLLY
ncbi:MAG: cytochrome c biogenesis protein CcsA, partial [Deltaproteobacteria bacterium]|nr:cytochrome c biogenesis protein CcsA [Deltaproteobacteria bacterium]